MIFHVFLSTETPADARLDRNLSYSKKREYVFSWQDCTEKLGFNVTA